MGPWEYYVVLVVVLKDEVGFGVEGRGVEVDLGEWGVG